MLVRTQSAIRSQKATNIGEKRGTTLSRNRHITTSKINDLISSDPARTVEDGFETAIIECYRRRESSVEEALIEMYLAGISVRRVEDITEALWGTRVSPSTVSNLNKKDLR